MYIYWGILLFLVLLWNVTKIYICSCLKFQQQLNFFTGWIFFHEVKKCLFSLISYQKNDKIPPLNFINFNYDNHWYFSRGFSMAHGSVTQDDRANTLANVTKTIGNLLDGYDIRLRPNFGGRLFSSFFLICSRRKITDWKENLIKIPKYRHVDYNYIFMYEVFRNIVHVILVLWKRVVVIHSDK